MLYQLVILRVTHYVMLAMFMGNYLGIVIFIRDKFHPEVIVSDEFGRLIVVQICYEGRVLQLVGVYASNVSQEQKLLWRSLNSVLDNGRSKRRVYC